MMQLLDIDLRLLFGILRLLCLAFGCIGRLADELIRRINALNCVCVRRIKSKKPDEEAAKKDGYAQRGQDGEGLADLASPRQGCSPGDRSAQIRRDDGPHL
jgi:hypothetical protein